MLVLSRKRGQRIVIADEIVIEVLEARGDGKIRLGIIAPDDISVHREEVYEVAFPDKKLPGKHVKGVRRG